MTVPVDDVALPLYAHLPLLVNEQRKKLSKRKDPVAIESYRDQGYLPEAFVNYLALLGWSPRGDEEIVPLATIVEQFRLEDVSHSPAFFDVKKLTPHERRVHSRAMSLEEFIEACAPWVRRGRARGDRRDREVPWTRGAVRRGALRARRATRAGARRDPGRGPAMVAFFFLDEVPIDDAAFDKVIAQRSAAARRCSRSAIERFAERRRGTPTALHEATLELGEALVLNLRKAQAPIRCAVTGTSVGPPLFESLELLGRERGDRASARRALARCSA